jgi:hypothetical protein
MADTTQSITDTKVDITPASIVVEGNMGRRWGYFRFPGRDFVI